MAKPIQIAATHTRGEHEQFGHSSLIVLCDDGSVWYQDSHGGNATPWGKIEGPWEHASTAREEDPNADSAASPR